MNLDLKQLATDIKTNNGNIEEKLKVLIDYAGEVTDVDKQEAIFVALQENHALRSLVNKGFNEDSSAQIKIKALLLLKKLVRPEKQRQPIFSLISTNALVVLLSGREENVQVKENVLGLMGNLCTTNATIKKKSFFSRLFKYFDDFIGGRKKRWK